MVARRYANAIFALGREEGDQALSAHGACLASLGEMLAAAPDLGQTLKSPVIGVEEKKAVLGKLLDKLKADQTMRNFCLTKLRPGTAKCWTRPRVSSADSALPR